MGTGAFPFSAATFYRWVERSPEVCPRLATRDEDVLLALGNLQRRELRCVARLATEAGVGIDDFDDAWELPWTSDLVRLAAALLAAEAAALDVSAGRVCALLLKGYRAGLAPGARQSFFRRPTPGTGHAHERHAGKTEDVLENRLDSKDNPLIDAGELPKGLEHMFRASVSTGCTSGVP